MSTRTRQSGRYSKKKANIKTPAAERPRPAVPPLTCYSLRVTWFLAMMVMVGSTVPSQASGPPTATDGRELEAALARILLNAATPRGGRERRVVITERAVNGFLRFQAADQLPPGLTEPELRMEAGGRLTVTATVDLDSVREQQSPGRFNPLRFLGGQLPVTAVGYVRSAGRTLTIDIESARVGSLSVPTTLVAELVQIYTRSDQYPDGIDVSEPIALPRGIDAVRIEQQRTVVVQ